MLEEEATLLERVKGFQIIGSKCKDIAARNEERQQLFKKTRGKQLRKYYRGVATKIRVLTPVRSM